MQKHIVIDARIRRAGTGRYIDRLLWHLQDIDSVNRYSILLEPSDSWTPKATNFAAVPCRYKQFSFSPIEQFGFARQLYKLKPDLVHFAMTQQPVLYFGQIVTTTHDLTMFEYTHPGKSPGWLHKLKLIGYRFLFWWGHKKSRHILVPSRWVADGLAKFQPFTAKKITVTYEAADVLPDRPVQPKDVKPPFIFHVGSPFPHKNIEGLVKAFERLMPAHPDLQLVLAGKKEHYFEQLEAWVQTTTVKDSVIFTNRVSDAELKWLFKNASAYVLPSLSEGFGLPGVEAMLYGCPLVSSNATCLPEIYGSSAEYFNPANIEDMANAIGRVLTSAKLREGLVEKGAKQAAKYSWANMAKQTLKVYESM